MSSVVEAPQQLGRTSRLAGSSVQLEELGWSFAIPEKLKAGPSDHLDAVDPACRPRSALADAVEEISDWLLPVASYIEAGCYPWSTDPSKSTGTADTSWEHKQVPPPAQSCRHISATSEHLGRNWAGIWWPEG